MVMVRVTLEFKTPLEAAQFVAGGPGSLAKELGVTTETLRLWRLGRLGITEERLEQIQAVIDKYSA